MTKFVTYYNLCPIPEPKEFLGISPGKDESNLIVTLDKNIVMIIKTSTQKQIRSWSVIEKLSSKVVYNKKSDKYVAVFANKSIRCWDEDVVDVNKCKKLKFQRCIVDLISTGQDTLVLYSDGSCQLLAEAIASRKTDPKEAGINQTELLPHITYTNASVHTLASGEQILTYFEMNSKNSDYFLISMPLNSESAEVKRFRLKRHNLDVNVAGAAVIEGDSSPMLLTIWSDKRIFLLSLAHDISPDRSPGNFVSLLPQLKVDCPLSVLGISKHFVAIYGANHGQEGASLLLYNTQYKVIKTKQFFKVYFNYSQLWTVDEHIVLAMGQNLSVVKYRVLKEVLSELVGTQVSNDYKSPVEIEHINEEEILEQCLQYSEYIQGNADSKTEGGKGPKTQPADGITVPYNDSREFDKSLNALRQTNLHVSVVYDGASLGNDQICLMTNYSDHGFVCPEIQTIAQQLERAGAGENEISEKLLAILIRADLIEDIGVCLRRYTNVSEKTLSKTLGYVLGKHKGSERQEKAKISNGVHETHEHMDVELSIENETNRKYPNIDLLDEKYEQNCNASEIEDILNILLSCPFDEQIIAVHIRQDIEYAEVVILLQHLYDMLAGCRALPLAGRPALLETSVESEAQLFRWFGIILDSHFQNLALAKDDKLIELLFKWHDLFQDYKREITELQQLGALLYNIMERKTHLKDSCSSKWYSIEEVYLF